MMRCRYLCLIFYLTAATISAQLPAIPMLFGYAGGSLSDPDDAFCINVLTFPQGSLRVDADQAIEMFFTETSATIGDSAGNALFYFNGVYIEDRLGAVMENGDTITEAGSTGYPLPQGGLILPFPGQPSHYLLFHVAYAYLQQPPWGLEGIGLYYSIIDMNGNGGLGSVVERKVPVLIDTLEYGKIAVTRHANGRDWWLAAAESHSNRFFRVLIDPGGVQLFGAQEVGAQRSQGIGQAGFSPDGMKYAMSSSTGASEGQFVEVYDFDRCSGAFSNHRRLHFPPDGVTRIGGAVFSPNARWLYVPYHTELFQYDLWADTLTTSQTLVATYEPYNDPLPTTFFLGFLAPDNQIYLTTTSGSQTLHVIRRPDEAGTACDVAQHAVHLPCYNARSLPNYADYRLGPLDGSDCDTLGLDNLPVAWWRYSVDSLAPQNIAFTDLSYQEPMSWAWDFGDPDAGSSNVSTERHPVHEFSNAGAHQVCLTVSNAYGADVHCKIIGGTASAASLPHAFIFRTSPNPFLDRLIVEIGRELSDPVLQLYDARGNLCCRKVLFPGENRIDTAALPAGFYVCNLVAGGRRLGVAKLVKIRP